MLTTINPASLGAPKGYSQGMLAPEGGRLLFVAGQVGWDEQERFVGSGLVDQFAKALDNALQVVREAGGGPDNVARMTFYVVDKQEYCENLKAVGQSYREAMGRHYPAMTLVEVKSLLEPQARIEIEVTAVIDTNSHKSWPHGPQ